MPFESTNFSDKILGYAQAAAGGIDTATAVSTLSFAGVVGIPAGTARLVIKCEVQAVRFRDDGTDPTATVGYPLAVGVEYVYTGRSFTALKFISQTAGAVLNVLAYGT